MGNFTAGEPITAQALNLATEKIIAQGSRPSSSTGTTTEIGVLRLDDVQLTGGRIYRVYTNSVGVDSTVANDGIRLSLRYTIDGSTPSVSSTVLTISQALQANAAHGEYTTVDARYAPASDEMFSVLLTVGRSTGSGTVVATGGTGVPGPIELTVEDMGLNPGDTGTDI